MRRTLTSCLAAAAITLSVVAGQATAAPGLPLEPMTGTAVQELGDTAGGSGSGSLPIEIPQVGPEAGSAAYGAYSVLFLIMATLSTLSAGPQGPCEPGLCG
ncbi:hypothetical protein [Nocardia higoensis]|uniref:hypothetical protein n=1 Tax=Nocardia higoensis TaxID=228599 RepID=UPI0002DCAC96|nr:hypothetical protein [Nocardia higoensis]